LVEAFDFGEAESVTLRQVLAHAYGQGGDLDEAGRISAIDGIVELAGTVSWLIGAEGFMELSEIHAHKRFGHAKYQGSRIAELCA
jgi:hypothetical protein